MLRNLRWVLCALVVALGITAQPAAAQQICPVASLAPPGYAGVTQTFAIGQPSPCPPPGVQADYDVSVDFGDGTTGTATFDDIWLLRAEHVFERAGSYTVVASVRHRVTGEAFALSRQMDVPDPFTTVTRRAPWRLFDVSRDGRTLDLRYQGGGCLDPDGRAEVRETRRSVSIVVRQTAHEPVGPQAACAAYLTSHPLRVRLARPIAGRKLRGSSDTGVGSGSHTKTPHVTGLRAADARVMLKAAGLRPTGLERGRVRAQVPAAGSKLPRDRRVRLLSGGR